MDEIVYIVFVWGVVIGVEEFEGGVGFVSSL